MFIFFPPKENSKGLAAKTIGSQYFFLKSCYNRECVGESLLLLHMKEVVQLALNIHSSSSSCGKQKKKTPHIETVCS